MMDLISVIVPVYNVEKYLDQCISSIVSQTYRNLEIILVDDGSTDNCPAMCDAWAAKDSRIKVIHKENGGLSDARNAGMAVATGEWISFVDSDDWLAENFYDILLNAAIENAAEIAASGIIKACEQEACFFGNHYHEITFTPSRAIRTIMNGDGFHAVAWNKLYRCELLNGICFPVGKLHEDEFVMHRLIDRAHVLVLCQNAIYYYRQRAGSIMATWSVKHLDALEAYLDRIHLLEEKYPELYLTDRVIFCGSCVNYYRKLLIVNAGREHLCQVASYRIQVHISLEEWCPLC